MSEYKRMVEVGLFTEPDRVELLRGEIVEMSPINVHRDDGYRTTTRYSQGETISLLAFPDVTLNVDEILGTGS